MITVSNVAVQFGKSPFVKEQVDLCFDKMTHQMTDNERSEFKRLLTLAAEAAIEMDD